MENVHWFKTFPQLSYLGIDNDVSTTVFPLLSSAILLWLFSVETVAALAYRPSLAEELSAM